MTFKPIRACESLGLFVLLFPVPGAVAVQIRPELSVHRQRPLVLLLRDEGVAAPQLAAVHRLRGPVPAVSVREASSEIQSPEFVVAKATLADYGQLVSD